MGEAREERAPCLKPRALRMDPLTSTWQAMQGWLWVNFCNLCGAHSSAAGPWECVFIYFFSFNSEPVKKKAFILSVIGKQENLVPFKSVLQPQFAVLVSPISLLQSNLEELVQKPSLAICLWGVGFGSSQPLESAFPVSRANASTSLG